MTQPDGSGSCCTPPNLPPVDAPQEEVTIFLTRASASFRRFTRTPPTKLFPSVNSQNSELSANSHSCSRSLPASACSPIPLVQLQIFRDLVASPSDGGVRLGFGRLQGLGHAAHDASDATPTLTGGRGRTPPVLSVEWLFGLPIKECEAPQFTSIPTIPRSLRLPTEEILL